LDPEIVPIDLKVDGKQKRMVPRSRIVALDRTGRPSFNLLQNFEAAEAIVLYAFDLPMLASTDLRSRPLEQRRALTGIFRKVRG
jgi:ATP-dependent DNA ligase